MTRAIFKTIHHGQRMTMRRLTEAEIAAHLRDVLSILDMPPDADCLAELVERMRSLTACDEGALLYGGRSVVAWEGDIAEVRE